MKLFEFGNHFSRVFCFAAALAVLSGCLDGSNSSGTLSTRASQSNLSFDYLPDPMTWSAEQMFYYFADIRGQDTPRFLDHTVSGQLATMCGPSGTTVSKRPDLRGNARIRAYREDREQTPVITKCWSDNAPAVIMRRAAEIQYLKQVLPHAIAGGFQYENRPGNMISLASMSVHNSRFYGSIFHPDYDVSYEVSELDGEMQRLAARNDVIDGAIGRVSARQREERERWQRAATWALNDFARDNPFNRPGPGQTAASWMNGSTASDPVSGRAIQQYTRTVISQNSPVQRTLTFMERSRRPANCFRVPAQDRCLSASEYNVWVANNRDDMANNIEQSRLAADRWHETAQAQVSSLLEDERRAREQGYSSSSDRTGGSDVVAE